MAEKFINPNSADNTPEGYVKDQWQAQLMAEKQDIQMDALKASREMIDVSKKKWGARNPERADVLEQSHQELVDKFDMELEEYGENMAEIIHFLDALRDQASYASNPEELLKQHEMEVEIDEGLSFFGLMNPDIKAPHVPAIGLFIRQPNISRAARLSDAIFDAHRTSKGS